MMALFNGRVIAITGAASGIGLATAHLLASRNATLSLADANADSLERAEKELKQKFPSVQILPYTVDVRSEEQVAKWIETTVGVFGRLDGAANMAGVIGKSIGLKGIAQQDVSEWDFIMDVNLKGLMLCLKHQLQHISEGGSIVNAASIAGVQGRPNNAAYAASKHGVIGLTRSAAKEVGHKNVRVNAICPGYIETPMSANSKKIVEENSKSGTQNRSSEVMSVALKRSGKADEVAELIAYLLGDGASFITGNAMHFGAETEFSAGRGC